jgi:hypothetical protein
VQASAINPVTRKRACFTGSSEDPAVIQRILGRLGLPDTWDDPQPPCSMTAAGAEQPTLPGVTV